MGIDFGKLKKKAEEIGEKHGDKIEQGVDKAGEFAKGKFGGHADKIDKATDKAKDVLPGGGPDKRGDSGNQ
ncbi:antitoxin protein of toxin-antitoxin system [Herbihabitans rhizosphaerae]|uniref:Antitoxin protein of toxin-antitoxin system n=1 Tax=Herbihabitans rhizosphaerae TaxID=1872711 RepID=A0A4Q7L6M0_9PSEU|nr:antitoxin [Herbihabitans rhizosphaerae]RZS44997.1 antitoxin protein of toxin-antitoxin system [Herbihabitans rhizosphaerae]